MELECSKCKLYQTCPRTGSSPLVTLSGRVSKCRLIGNYGREPVDESILSPESLVKFKTQGECTSYVEIPELDKDSGMLHYITSIIFHKPVLHTREAPVPDILQHGYKRSWKA